LSSTVTQNEKVVFRSFQGGNNTVQVADGGKGANMILLKSFQEEGCNSSLMSTDHLENNSEITIEVSEDGCGLFSTGN
jgi:uncharacterized protein YgiM (DUF1202 family)